MAPVEAVAALAPVLARHANDQLLHLALDPRSARTLTSLRVREFTSDHACVDTEYFQVCLETLAKNYPRQLILLFVDGAGDHHSDELEVPPNIILQDCGEETLCGMKGKKTLDGVTGLAPVVKTGER